MRQYDTVVVGAGFAGSIVAERLASQLGHSVLVIDRRDHIAGNAYDYIDDHGVLVHRYGPHIFHTNSEDVVDYLSQFTTWRPYEHRVLANVDGQLVPVPINRTTVNLLYGLNLADEQACQAYFDSVAVEMDRMETSEDSVVAKVGTDLYEKLFRGYTRKQWDLDPRELHASVTARIPVRTDTDDRYFTDSFQKVPEHGYSAMFRKILSNPGIEVALSTDWDDIAGEVDYGHLVWTGPIDAFFDHRFGRLPYRSLEFEFETYDTGNDELIFPVAQMNEPSEEVPYTRRSEFRHITGQGDVGKSTIAIEYSRAEGDPYYPVPRDENRLLFKQYRELADKRPDVTFVGRLANYQYLNMDQVTAQALSTFRRMVESNAVVAK